MKIKSMVVLLALGLSACSGGKYAGVPKEYHELLNHAMVTAGFPFWSENTMKGSFCHIFFFLVTWLWLIVSVNRCVFTTKKYIYRYVPMWAMC